MKRLMADRTAIPVYIVWLLPLLKVWVKNGHLENIKNHSYTRSLSRPIHPQAHISDIYSFRNFFWNQRWKFMPRNQAVCRFVNSVTNRQECRLVFVIYSRLLIYVNLFTDRNDGEKVFRVRVSFWKLSVPGFVLLRMLVHQGEIAFVLLETKKRKKIYVSHSFVCLVLLWSFKCLQWWSLFVTITVLVTGSPTERL